MRTLIVLIFMEYKMKGKAYANRKSEDKRPQSDFYVTPKSLVWELLKTDVLKGSKKILEPCCGKHAISSELEKAGFDVTSKDIMYGDNFLCSDYKFGEFDTIVTNPPFSQFDDIVMKAKKVAPKVVMIAKTNFFGAYARNKKGVWKHLKEVYIFNRQLDYRTPERDDGLFHVGNLITGWFVWDNSWNEDYWQTRIIDVQQYAKLGGIKE